MHCITSCMVNASTVIIVVLQGQITNIILHYKILVIIIFHIESQLVCESSTASASEGIALQCSDAPNDGNIDISDQTQSGVIMRIYNC